MQEDSCGFLVIHSRPCTRCKAAAPLWSPLLIERSQMYITNLVRWHCFDVSSRTHVQASNDGVVLNSGK